jgi:uncharacterized protein (TIRG00374 family)
MQRARLMRRLAIGLVGPLVSIAALALVLRSVDLGGTLRAISHAQAAFLLPILLLVGVGIELRSWRWQRLLPTDEQAFPLRRITPVLLIGYLGNAVLPARLGEPIRAYLLARRERLSSFHVLGTVLLERIVDVAVLALMAFVCALAVAAPSWVVQLTAVAAAAGILVVGILTVVGFAPAVRLLDRLVRPLPWSEQVVSRLDRFAAGLGGSAQRGPVLQATALSVPIWIVDASICWLAAKGLGLTLDPAHAMLIVAVGALGTSIPSAPGYVGTYELAASAAGRAAGLDPESALGLALVLHSVTLIPVGLAGAAALVIVHAGSLGELASEATHGADASGSSRPPRIADQEQPTQPRRLRDLPPPEAPGHSQPAPKMIDDDS